MIFLLFAAAVVAHQQRLRTAQLRWRQQLRTLWMKAKWFLRTPPSLLSIKRSGLAYINVYCAHIDTSLLLYIAPSEEIKTLFFLLAGHSITYIYPVYIFSFCQSCRLFPVQVNNRESQLKYTILLDPRLHKSTCPIAHEDRSVFDFCLSCAIASSSRLLYKDLTDTLSARLEKDLTKERIRNPVLCRCWFLPVTNWQQHQVKIRRRTLKSSRKQQRIHTVGVRRGFFCPADMPKGKDRIYRLPLIYLCTRFPSDINSVHLQHQLSWDMEIRRRQSWHE